MNEPQPQPQSQPEPMPAWMRVAECRGVPTDIFYPENGESERSAKIICSRCSHATECLEFALEHHERFGVWGGTSERERRSIARRRNLGGVA